VTGSAKKGLIAFPDLESIIHSHALVTQPIIFLGLVYIKCRGTYSSSIKCLFTVNLNWCSMSLTRVTGLHWAGFSCGLSINKHTRYTSELKSTFIEEISVWKTALLK